MQAAHKQAMCTALGEIPLDWAVRLDAASSAAGPRDRLWLSNCPPAEDSVAHPRPPSPWERRWTHQTGGRIPTWTQSRAPASAPEAI
eukprot:2606379-Pyramimonas_sp.AAC.1